MWSGDDDDDAMSVESMLEEDKDAAVRARLEESLEFPLVCPVCAACSYKSKQLKTRVALLQHAKEKVKDTTSDMKKVTHFHQQLVEKIQQLDEDEAGGTTQALPSLSSGSGVGREILGSSFTRTVEMIDQLGENMKDGRRMMTEMETSKVKKQRQSVKVSSTQEEIRHRLRVCQQQWKELQDQKLAEVALYEEKIKEALQKRDEELSAKRAAIASLEKSAKETQSNLSLDRKIENSKKLFSLRKECERMEKEKKTTEERLRDHQRRKAVALSTHLMQRREGEEILRAKDKKTEEYRQTKAKAEAKIEEHLVASIAKLGLDDPRLAPKCRCCGTEFQTSKTGDPGRKVSKRMILFPCGCTSMCEDCSAKRRTCPGHSNVVVQIVKSIPFSKVFG